ncbi:MAG: hypothetical protein KBD78_12900 [Oligoflexales bacterium]|nr:hypothetical protein [Oligoflexales bacterium]
MHVLEFEIKKLRFFIFGALSFIALSSACGFAPMKKVEVPETRVAGPNLTRPLTEIEDNKKTDCETEEESQPDIPTEILSEEGEQSCDQIISEE